MESYLLIFGFLIYTVKERTGNLGAAVKMEWRNIFKELQSRKVIDSRIFWASYSGPNIGSYMWFRLYLFHPVLMKRILFAKSYVCVVLSHV